MDAFGLAVRGGHWYLVGLDLDREEIRSFRLSRISDDLEIVGEGTEPPEGFRAAEHVQAGPWGPGDAEATATIAFAPDVAWWATEGVASAETVRTREDGWIEVAGALVARGRPGPVDPVVRTRRGGGGAPELRSEILGRLEAIVAS